MPSREAKRLPAQKELARLQQVVLRAALLGEPLPGGGSAQLSDQAFIFRHSQIYLVDENLAGPMSIKGLPKPLRVLSSEDLRREANVQGDDVAYLRFLPLQTDEHGGVWLTLEGRISPQDSSQHAMGLSSIQVKLSEVKGRWQTGGETRALAG